MLGRIDLSDKLSQEIDGQRKDDGRIFLSRNRTQSLSVCVKHVGRVKYQREKQTNNRIIIITFKRLITSQHLTSITN